MTSEQPCRFILSEAAGGAMNMALDEALLQSAAEQRGADQPQAEDAVGVPVLRVYQWARPTLSLGYFQAVAERETHAPSRECDLVRRPSGGGAILHDRELTYALVLPERIARRRPHAQWYFDVHRALISVLEAQGITQQLSLCADPPEIPPSEQPFLCFARRAEGDVLMGTHKIAGSAQRRRGGAILQHGSILWRRSAHAPELPGIADLVTGEIPFASFREAFAGAVAASLKFELTPSQLTGQEQATALQLHTTKYGAPSWTLRR